MKKFIPVGLVLAAPLAMAALGEQPGDADTPSAQKLAATTSAGVPYRHISRTVRGKTQVHEFVDATGTVFAVSWSGPFKPDLSKLLGRHFEAFQKGEGKRTGDRTRQRVETDEMVVVSAGHMGALIGRAWLPARLPAGFDPEAMK